MNWKEDEAEFLDRTAERLGGELGRRISRSDVLRALVQIAMAQEAVEGTTVPIPASLGLELHELCRILQPADDR